MRSRQKQARQDELALKTGIITALRSEALCLTGGTCEPGIATPVSASSVLVLSGMGQERVESAIDTLTAWNVDLLLSFGTAAALAPGLKAGDLVVPENIILADNSVLDISNDQRERLIPDVENYPFSVHTGDMCESSTIVGSAADKADLFKTSGAVALDMESGVIARAASALQLPVLVLRIIVDDVDTSIPADVINCCDQYGVPNPWPLSLAVLKNPMLISQLIGLGRGFASARKGMSWLAGNIALLNPRPDRP